MRVEEAEVVLHLNVEVSADKREAFLAFCARAFPVYESLGGLKMALYEDVARPGRFDEVGYYETMDAYQRGERAIVEDAAQAALLREWRGLLAKPPAVSVVRRRA